MRRLLLILALLLYTTGCAPQLSLHNSGMFAGAPDIDRQHAAHAQRSLQDSRLPGLRVSTRDDGMLLFAEDGWRLTMSGIEGQALVTTADGAQFTADTTLSYWDATSAASTGRGNTMSQFLLTILGVILVLGLAAIILYAAFLATAR
jgi:hypothetical protein